MPLPKEIKQRIFFDSANYSVDMNLKLAYKAGATTEAERSQKLIAALEEIIKMSNAGKTLSHVDSHVAAYARKALAEYNNHEIKKV
jgi:hypothetical protein